MLHDAETEIKYPVSLSLAYLRSGLGLLMGEVCQILTELPARDIFSFPDDNLSKCQGILTNFGTCIDIMEIWFGIANGKFRQFLTE